MTGSRHTAPWPRDLSALLILYALAVGAGWLCAQMRVPLPWMIGPLVLSAAGYMSGLATVPVPLQTRPFGQITIAAQVGLAFTPAALGAVLSLGPLMIAAALATAICACAVAIVLARTARMRLVEAFLASFPTSPVEAAIMAERHGLDPAPIVLAQTMRIAAVVMFVPLAVYALDGWPDRSAAVFGAPSDVFGNCLLAVLAVCGAVAFRRIGLSNPFFLGPLAFSAAAAAAGLPTAAFPAIVLSAAQVVLGTWLGSTFRRELVLGNGRLFAMSAVATLLLLGMVSSLAVALAALSGLDWEVMVLGLAPGGVTEMALTAKFLGANVAIVTAFQLTRIFLFMPNMPWIIGLIDRCDGRTRCRPK